MAYIPRLTRYSPTNMDTDPIYNAWQTVYPSLPNCTAYAWSRFWEIYGPTSMTDNRPTLCPYDARHWYNYTQDGYQRGQTPKLGAIICWDDPDSAGGGHVAIVEEILQDGRIRCSNSAYTRDPQLTDNYYFFTETVSNTYQRPGGYPWIFQGFIYNPYAEQSTGKTNIAWLTKMLRRRKKYGSQLLAPSGIPGRK